VRKYVLLLIVAVCAVGCTQTKEPEKSPEDKLKYEIAKIIADNKILGCTEFYWQQPSSIPYEYIVYCSKDGFNWEPYFVRTKKGTIVKGIGPSN
jgi:hypothetical protein